LVTLNSVETWSLLVGMAASMIGAGVFFGVVTTKLSVMNDTLLRIEKRFSADLIDLEHRVRELEYRTP